MASCSLPRERVTQTSPPADRCSVLASCVREAFWLVAAIATAVLAVAVLAGMGLDAPLDAGLLDAMAAPVNLARAAVLAAVLWVWSYIERAIRGVPARRMPGA